MKENLKYRFEISLQRWDTDSKTYQSDEKSLIPEQLLRGEGADFAGIKIQIDSSVSKILLRKTVDFSHAFITTKFEGSQEENREIGKDIMRNLEERERTNQLFKDFLGPDMLEEIPSEKLKAPHENEYWFSIEDTIENVLQTNARTEWSQKDKPASKLERMEIYERKPKNNKDHPDKLVITVVSPNIGESGDFLS